MDAREQECGRKKAYESYLAAEKALKWMVRDTNYCRDPVDDREMKPYHCRFCGEFHLGHIPIHKSNKRKEA